VTEANTTPPTPTPPRPQDQAGIHRRLVQGIAGKAVGTAILFGEQILLVPVFLLFWSPGQYGDWLVLLSTAGFIGLLDIGLSAYYGNALQRALARGKQEEFSTLLKQGAFLYAALIALGLLVVLVVGFQVSWPELLNLRNLSALTATQVFCFLSASFLLMLPFGFISSVYRAYGEFVISVMVNNLMRLGLIACIAMMLSIGASADVLALTYAAIALLTWLGIIIHQRRRYPDLRYGLAIPDKEALRTALSIGPAYAVVPAAMALTIHGTVLLISALASSGATIAAYSTIRTLTSLAKHVTSEFLQVLGVEGARQYAQEDWEALSRLYKFVSRVSGCCCGFLGGFIAIIGPPFFSLWTIGKLTFSGDIFWPLLASAVCAGPSLAGVAILYFINKPRGMVTAHIAGGITVTLLCLILIPKLGAAGAAWAILVAESCILSIVLPFYAARIVRENPVRQIFIGQAFAFTAFSISAGISWVVLNVTGSAVLLSLILAGLLWATLIAPAVYFLVFRESERDWIKSRALRLFRRG
jgi:O-antigen/teichoic acid export membrane protein